MQLLLWLILVWEAHHLESWLHGNVEKNQFLEVFVMQEYPWADELSKAVISDGSKAVKGSEVYKGIDKMFVLNCPVCMSYCSPVS